MEPSTAPPAPRVVIGGLSAAVFGAIALVLLPGHGHHTSSAPGIVPSVNAALNATSALLLEEMSFHMYPRIRDVMHLLFLAVAENLGYRQLNTLWRFIGILYFVTGRKSTWGAMPRKAGWAKEAA